MRDPQPATRPTATAKAPRPPQESLDPLVMRTAWAVLVGGLAVLFDTTIVAVGVRTLATELAVGIDTIQWVSTAYLLALAVAVPLVGWAQRVFGARRLWLAALTIFLAGSILCSLAWDAASLIAFRAVQGIGGGLMMPLMMTIIMQAAGGKQLGKVASIIGIPIALGPVLGPVLGGLILQHLHWSWMFWVNVPFCIAGIILAVVFLPHDGPIQRARLDLLGLVLLAPGLVAVLYGLSNVSRDGALARADVWAPALAGLALVAAFCWRAGPRGGAALVNVALMRHRPLTVSSVLMFLSGFGLFGSMFLLPLYFQTIRGHDVLTTGLLLIPQGVGTLLSRVALGRVIDRIGPRWVALGAFVLTGIATIPFAYAGVSTSEWWLMGVLLVRGLGLGAALIPLMGHAYVGIEKPDVPDASIVTRLVQQLGGSFGTAILATVLAAASSRATTPAEAAAAFDQAFWWAIGFTALAVALCFLLPASAAGSVTPRASEGRVG